MTTTSQRNTEKWVNLLQNLRERLPAGAPRFAVRVICSLALVCAAWIAAENISEFHTTSTFPDLWGIIFGAFLIGTNICLAPFRLRAVTHRFGHQLALRTCAQAIVAAFAGGALGLSLPGQAGGCIGVLAARGVPAKSATAIFAVERVIALAILATLAVCAGAWIYEYPASMVAAVIALVVVLACARLLNLMLATSLTLVMQSAMALAWLALLWSNAASANILAAAVLTMLSAAIPLGIAGFGPREVGAAAIFPVAGVDPASAIAAALLIGTLSAGAMMVLAIVAIYRPRQKNTDV